MKDQLMIDDNGKISIFYGKKNIFSGKKVEFPDFFVTFPGTLFPDFSRFSRSAASLIY